MQRKLAKTLADELQAVSRLKQTIQTPAFLKAIKLLRARKGKIVVTGVGKSGFIGMKIAATLTSLGHLAVFLHPVEAMHGDIGVVGKGDVILALSFSGNSSEIIRIVRYLKHTFRVPIISITGNKASLLAKESDAPIVIDIAEEGCPLGLAPMASTTATLVVGDLIASALTEPKKFEHKHFARFHPGGSLGLSLTEVARCMTSGKAMPLVRKNEPLAAALKEMTEKKFGVVGVVDGNTLVGVITDGDVRRFFLRYESARGKCAGNAMTKNPKTITQSRSLSDALMLMKEHKITNLFVVDGALRPIGIIHMHDILEGQIG